MEKKVRTFLTCESLYKCCAAGYEIKGVIAVTTTPRNMLVNGLMSDWGAVSVKSILEITDNPRLYFSSKEDINIFKEMLPNYKNVVFDNSELVKSDLLSIYNILKDKFSGTIKFTTLENIALYCQCEKDLSALIKEIGRDFACEQLDLTTEYNSRTYIFTLVRKTDDRVAVSPSAVYCGGDTNRYFTYEPKGEGFIPDED